MTTTKLNPATKSNNKQNFSHHLSDGTLKVEGEHVSFIADDFATKLSIGAGNDVAIKASSRNTTHVELPVVDANILEDLQKNCENLSDSVDAVLHEITNRLSKISAISVGNVQTCTGAVNDMNKQVEDAVHSMYSLIAHCEEMDRAMKPVCDLANKIEHIKDVLSALELHVQ